mmetsp:Transcript_64466/g.94426  ORF Transcript_64466/g.94426 Transcript_64466/m.94426 type:complete len:338 (+) Transcript_64466:1182-2195(+)
MLGSSSTSDENTSMSAAASSAAAVAAAAAACTAAFAASSAATAAAAAALAATTSATSAASASAAPSAAASSAAASSAAASCAAASSAAASSATAAARSSAATPAPALATAAASTTLCGEFAGPSPAESSVGANPIVMTNTFSASSCAARMRAAVSSEDCGSMRASTAVISVTTSLRSVGLAVIQRPRHSLACFNSASSERSNTISAPAFADKSSASQARPRRNRAFLLAGSSSSVCVHKSAASSGRSNLIMHAAQLLMQFTRSGSAAAVCGSRITAFSNSAADSVNFDSRHSCTPTSLYDIAAAKSSTDPWAFPAVSAPPRIARKGPPEGGIRLTTP